MPKVSVITPCYNSARFVERTIASVRAQNFTDWEHVVVDDGSTDESACIVADILPEEPRLRLVRQPNGGVSRARNEGFKAASPESEYLLFLDADDVLEPTMLVEMAACLESRPEAGMAHCGIRFIDEEDREIVTEPYKLGFMPRVVATRLGARILSSDEVETPFEAIFNLAGIVPSLTLMRRSVYSQTPGWDEAFGQHYEDTDLFLQIAVRSAVRYVPKPLMKHRRHGNQSTADVEKFSAQEVKLYEKWRTLPGLTPEQRAQVDAAWRFRQGRFQAFIGWRNAGILLRQKHIGQALRFYGGAARRWIGSWAKG